MEFHSNSIHSFHKLFQRNKAAMKTQNLLAFNGVTYFEDKMQKFHLYLNTSVSAVSFWVGRAAAEEIMD